MCTIVYSYNYVIGKQQTVELLVEAQFRKDVTSLNEQVKKNRVIWRHYIDAVCYLANLEPPFWSDDESATSLKKGNFVEFLGELKNFDKLGKSSEFSHSYLI